MANKTTNYKLTKPLDSEFYDVAVQNDNMDIIDQALKAHADAMDTALEEIDGLFDTKQNLLKKTSVTIPVSAWKTNTDSITKAAGFLYYADVSISGLAATDWQETTLAVASLKVAKAAGVANTATGSAGKIRYYAVAKPTAALTATVRTLQGTN